MSLSVQQKENTRKELRANQEKAGVSVEQISDDLGTTTSYINQLFALEPKRLEDTWILRNYLLRHVKDLGQQPVEFTALLGDWHSYWFLDGGYIDGGKISTVKNQKF